MSDDSRDVGAKVDATGFKSDRLDGLVDVERLTAWLDRYQLAPGEALEVRRLNAGMSNESFRLYRGDCEWVLRRPAKVAFKGSDRGMQREFRVLSALEDTPVPHPRPLGLCTEPEVIGSAFYVMEYVEGFTSLDPLPDRFADDVVLRRQAALSYTEVLGRLARVDWRARGLETYGRPDGFHERQVSRWLAQLDSYGVREIPGIREVGKWLADRVPAPESWVPGIMHGDYHAANVLLAPDPPGRVAAILDWENSTIGDPLLDLGGFLRMWFDSDRADWAPRDEMIATWEAASGQQAPDLRYYTALSAFRLAVLVEGVYQRSVADATRGAAEGMEEVSFRLCADAQRAIDA